ncbi:MAG: archaetidylserine decarboxylase [Bdellovibrio sp.]
MSAITRFLPKRRLSRWIGHFMHWEGPSWWAHISIRAFAWFYNINLEEAEKNYLDYKSIGDFFVRRLKPEVRPVADVIAVHPADSRITQAYPIDGGSLVQAKGLSYSLAEFTSDPEWKNKWDGGFFITYYLCPTDYHRVHSPIDGDIKSIRYLPGELWPVNEWSTSNIPNLFSVNERILVEIDTHFGPVGVVFVGATNVGHIVLSFDTAVRGNPKGVQSNLYKVYDTPIPVKKGQELGMFRMGSTVVVLYPPIFRQEFEKQLDLGPAVRVNSALIL